MSGMDYDAEYYRQKAEHHRQRAARHWFFFKVYMGVALLFFGLAVYGWGWL